MLDTYKYKRVLLKISGEALAGGQGYGIDPKVVDDLAEEILPIVKDGVQLAVYFYPFPVDDPGHTRISARSRPGSPVVAKELAAHFGGGGASPRQNFRVRTQKEPRRAGAKAAPARRGGIVQDQRTGEQSERLRGSGTSNG